MRIDAAIARIGRPGSLRRRDKRRASPPHFHARYGSEPAIVAIDSLLVLEGKLSPRVPGLVMERAAIHQSELPEDWSPARAQAPPKPIEPPRSSLLKDVVEVRPLGRFRVRIRFEDGLQGEIDLRSVIDFKGVFAPLRDEREFAKVQVDSEHGTLVWPCGGDFDPDVLHSEVSGCPIRAPSAPRRPA
jgi:hypothetical protein